MNIRKPLFITVCLGLSACGSTPKEATLAQLSQQPLKLEPISSKPLNRANAAEYYRQFLEAAPPGEMYGDAMRRLADLELQTGQEQELSGNANFQKKGKRKIITAIRLYETFLETYPERKNNDLILYQLAKAYELNAEQEKLLATLDRIIREYPHTKHEEEVHFRRGETLFVLGQYGEAEKSYKHIIKNFSDSTYYDKALYKYGWTRFKQLYYPDALNAFMELLDRKHNLGQLSADGPAEILSRTERELLNDVLRVTSLSFSYQQGYVSINDFFKSHGERPYEALIYRNLGEFYLKKDQIRDAATTFLAFTQRHPTSELSPKYHDRAIAAYTKGGFGSLVLPTKVSYVQQYGVNTAFWNAQSQEVRDRITPTLKKHIKELANHYHALGRKHKKQQEFQQAINWYALYIKSFPNDIETAGVNFLLAEAYQDARYYQHAIYEFEKTAYNYPAHKQSDDAAYAALILYPPIEKTLQGSAKAQWQQKKISSALRFTSSFPENKNSPSILANTAEELFTLGDYARATSTAQTLTARNGTDPKLLVSALLVIGHSEFETKHYDKAEVAYIKLKTLLPKQHKELNNINEKLAASIYKQGEQAQKSGELLAAASIFLRVGKEVPGAQLRATAEYDAANIYVKLEKWPEAQNILENFRRQYPKNNLQFGVTEKLALVYSKSGQPLKAAKEIEYLANNAHKYPPEQRRDLLWQVGVLYSENGRPQQAQRILKDYVAKYPLPLEPAMEARQQLAEMSKKSSDYKNYYFWLREMISANNKGIKSQTDRTRYLAANAYMQLTLPLFNTYKAAKLTIPLKKSLKKKKDLMQNVVKSYENAMKYRVAEISTAATYYIAEIYGDFAGALLKSERPKKLSTDELEQYNVLLEEKAFPFEEKAIDIHIANAERVKDGIYDQWVKKSINALTKLSPVRFAKAEKSESYVEHIN